MAWVFVRLKAALLRSGFQASKGYLALYVIGSLLALSAGVIAGLLLASLLGEGGGETGEVLLLVALPMVWIFWIITPLLSGGQGDQTVDPSRLELLPLSFGQQVRGLLMAGLLGPAAAGTLLGALGPALARGEGIATRLFLVVVAVAFTVLCVAWSRSIGAAFAGILDSRRGKELLVVLAAVIVAPVYFITEALASATEALVKQTSAGWWNLLAVLPPGALGRSISAVRDGQWPLALLLLAWGIAGIAIALLVWRWALARRLNASGTSREHSAAGPIGESVLYPAYLRWLPRSPVGATTAKEMRYFLFRSTLQLQQLVLGAMLAILIVGSQVLSDDSSGMAAFLGAIVVFMVLFQASTNVFGIDNAAVSTYLLTGVDLARVLLGKFIALLLLALPLGVVFQVAIAILRRDTSLLWIGLVALPIPWLLWLGLGSVTSVKLAAPITPGKRSSGAGVVLGILGGLFGALFVAGVVIAAAAFVGTLTGSTWLGVAAAWLLSAAVGFTGLRVASSAVDRDPPALLARLGEDRL